MLEQALGYHYRDQSLLELALSHRSCGPRNNERLEFLGDAVLDLIIAEDLYRRFPSASEGELSRMRAGLVRGETLAELARNLHLGDHIRIGATQGGAPRSSAVLAGAVEALLGALLLDSGLDTCRQRVLHWLAPQLAAVHPGLEDKDPKTRLQEYLQGRGKALPEYQLLKTEGEDHRPQFTVACVVEGLPAPPPTGSGGSVRKAEQQAAAVALERLDG